MIRQYMFQDCLVSSSLAYKQIICSSAWKCNYKGIKLLKKNLNFKF